jgi:hypothetical protein
MVQELFLKCLPLPEDEAGYSSCSSTLLSVRDLWPVWCTGTDPEHGIKTAKAYGGGCQRQQTDQTPPTLESESQGENAKADDHADPAIRASNVPFHDTPP